MFKSLDLKKNLIAGINVGFLNLPMSMAFASASGLSPAVGITTAFWVSLFALLSDSHYAIVTTSLAMGLMSKSTI